jgi:hypothetical protein
MGVAHLPWPMAVTHESGGMFQTWFPQLSPTRDNQCDQCHREKPTGRDLMSFTWRQCLATIRRMVSIESQSSTIQPIGLLGLSSPKTTFST